MTKGYVVRGKDEDGDWVSTDAAAANEAAANYWISCADWQLSDVRILAVAEDGTETPIPSYGDALEENERLRDAHHCEAPECNKPADGVTCSTECSDNLSRWIAMRRGARRCEEHGLLSCSMCFGGGPRW